MKRFICFILLILISIFLYAKYVEPTALKVNEFVITNEKIPNSFDGFKILHFSDLLYHNENSITLLKKVNEETKHSNIDIIVFTGDLINKDLNEQDKKTLTSELKDMKANHYKYAILGDHDNNDVKHLFEESDFIILEETHQNIFNKGETPITILNGMDNQEETSLENYTIALIHKPDDFDKIKNNYDLILAGHSLGGEIRIPFLGAILKKDGAHKYTDNIYNKDNSLLHISYGLGSEKTKIRLFNMPSINIYRLSSK